MEHVTPSVSYLSIKIADQDILLSSSCRVSFQSPYNKITIQIQPTNASLSYYEVRITKADEAFDIGVGKLAYWSANIAANEIKTFEVNINEDLFSYGDSTYRISFYAKSAVDGSWDVSYLFFSSDSLQFTLADGSTFAVLTTQEAPAE